VTRGRVKAARGPVAWRIASVVLLLGASLARAQGTPSPVPPPSSSQPLPPDLIMKPVMPASRVRSQRPTEPLPPEAAMRLQRASDLRVSGLPERACDTLQAMLREYPHHPAIVTELGRAQLARADWSAVVRLGESERAATRDSSLLG